MEKDLPNIKRITTIPHAGIINHILSWKGFLPGSRLTYCAYLVAFGHINVFYAMNRRMIYYSFISQITTYFGIICYSFMVAFFLAVFFEASFLGFMKFLFDLYPSKGKFDLLHSSSVISRWWRLHLLHPAEDPSSVESDQESDTTKSTVSTTSSSGNKTKVGSPYLSPNFTKPKHASKSGKRSKF